MPIIFRINGVINFGSTGRTAEQLGELVLNRGWRSIAAHSSLYRRQSKSELIQVGTKWDQFYHAIETRLFDRHGLSSVSATKKLIKNINQINPDIVHLQNIHGYFINYPFLFDYLSKSNVPVVWTFHDCWPMTGHCVHFSDIGCERWKTGCFDCPQKNTYPASIWIDRSKRNYEDKLQAFTSLKNLTVVAVSDWLMELVKNSFFRNYNIRRIYNGVDLEIFKPLPKEKYNTKKLLIGVATSWTEHKGFNDYIRLRQLLTNEYEIVLIGLSPKLIKSLPTGITGIEKTESTRELAEWYNKADIVLNLSTQETFGKTTVEGLACGTPGIVYNSTASPELVTPDTGVIVEAGNISGIVAAIQNLLSRDQEQLSRACRERAVTQFNKNDRFQEYIDLYEELINNKTNIYA